MEPGRSASQWLQASRLVPKDRWDSRVNKRPTRSFMTLIWSFKRLTCWMSDAICSFTEARALASSIWLYSRAISLTSRNIHGFSAVNMVPAFGDGVNAPCCG